MLIGRKPKLPAQCKEVGTDIRQICDLDPSQVEQIISEVEDISFEVLMGIRMEYLMMLTEISKPLKRQKKNYYKRYRDEGEELNIGDLVVKKEQI